MRDAQAILEAVLLRIRRVYDRPLMYAETPQHVDTLLQYYHELWGMIVAAEEKVEAVERSAREEIQASAMSFATRYRRMRPKASEAQVANYVVRKWREIDKRLGITLPQDPLG
jgi:hypothetical protein